MGNIILWLVSALLIVGGIDTAFKRIENRRQDKQAQNARLLREIRRREGGM